MPLLFLPVITTSIVMLLMSDKIFLDTNVVVYLYSNDEPEKKATAMALFEQTSPIISTQVLSELANTLRRKFNLSYEVIGETIQEVQNACVVVPVLPETIVQALIFAKKYQYAYYDSLILASALAADCDTLFTEDLHHEQIVEKALIIRNPFLNLN
jgi:predicted nucleic acid-binding protein